MSKNFSPTTEQLWRLLPEIYRNKDRESSSKDNSNKEGHLKKYLGAFGKQLDQVRNTLEQRYADNFPDIPLSGLSAQDWLLPYFADLLDVRLISPDPDGQRMEISNAVRWRQRKGTTLVVEEIAEAITQLEAEVQEGWQRVILTARIGTPILSAKSLGLPENHPLDAGKATSPITAARHPGLPAGTLDLRHRSRAVRTTEGSPASRQTSFSGAIYNWPRNIETQPKPKETPETWRQANLHGNPCFPDSYEDVSVRTVDIRRTKDKTGWFHPKRVLIYQPPPWGLFPPNPEVVGWNNISNQSIPDFVRRHEDADSHDVSWTNTTSGSIQIDGDIVLNTDITHRFEKLSITGTITLQAGRLEMSHSAAHKIVVTPGAGTNDGQPAVWIASSLVGSVNAPDQTIVLDYATVLGETTCTKLLASEAVMMGDLSPSTGRGEDCIRYSRVPVKLFAQLDEKQRRLGNTDNEPVFVSSTFGDPHCGVLHPKTPGTISAGAEDGGEMGAFHDWRFAAGREASQTKLKDFMPLGTTSVTIMDDRLLCRPPKIIPTKVIDDAE